MSALSSFGPDPAARAPAPLRYRPGPTVQASVTPLAPAGDWRSQTWFGPDPVQAAILLLTRLHRRPGEVTVRQAADADFLDILVVAGEGAARLEAIVSGLSRRTLAEALDALHRRGWRP